MTNSDLTDRAVLIDTVKETLQASAKQRSKDGMTGISDDRAYGLALDVVDTLLLYHRQVLRRELDRREKT